MFLQHLANKLAFGWGKSYGQVLMWFRVRLVFAIIRATNLCLLGSRVQWRSGIGIDDGAGLPNVSTLVFLIYFRIFWCGSQMMINYSFSICFIFLYENFLLVCFG